MSQAAIIRKISSKTVLGNLKGLILQGLKDGQYKDGDIVDTMDIIGIVKKVTEGEHQDYGTYYEFGGSFEATAHMGGNAGVSFRAPKCFLPEAATELLRDQIHQYAEEHDGEMADIQIALKIQVRIDESVATNYVFQVTPLMTPESADPLHAIKEKAGLAQSENKEG